MITCLHYQPFADTEWYRWPLWLYIP